MIETDGPTTWSDSLCSSPENDHLKKSFFSSNYRKRQEAKSLCSACPMQEECLSWALNEKEIWGTWGGRSEDQNRKTLSVDENGNETRYQTPPRCPMCSAGVDNLETSVIPLEGGGRWNTARVVTCGTCGFDWKSRTSANAIDMFKERRAAREIRNAKRGSSPRKGIRQLPSTTEGAPE